MPHENEIDTPWKRVKPSHVKQEERVARKPGGRKQINSGRLWFSKRDVRWNGFLIENRTTDAQSYSIGKKEFEKITEDAIKQPPGLLPALQIDISGLQLFAMRFQDWEWFLVKFNDLMEENERLRNEARG